jgi:hypothetical protein
VAGRQHRHILACDCGCGLPDVDMYMLSSGDSMMLALPPGTLRQGEGCVPALSDNGASFKSSCAKTTQGAVLSTFKAEDAGTLNVGDENGALQSMGSYLYVYERYDARLQTAVNAEDALLRAGDRDTESIEASGTPHNGVTARSRRTIPTLNFICEQLCVITPVL